MKLAGTEGLQRQQFRLTLGLERSFNHQYRVRFEGTWQQQDITLFPSSSADELYIRFRVYRNY